MKSDEVNLFVLKEKMVLSDVVLDLSSTRFTVNNVDNRLDDLSVYVNDMLEDISYRSDVIKDIKQHFSDA